MCALTPLRDLKQALVDGFLFPLRLHPAFWSLVRGDGIDPVAYLPSAHSHLVKGQPRGAHLAPLFALIPELDAAHARASPAAAAAALGALGSEPRDFTQGLPLEDWLSYLPWADPITGAALLKPPSFSPSTLMARPRSGTWWKGSDVNMASLRNYLEQLSDLWIGRGVARQAAAFRDGLGDLVSQSARVIMSFLLFKCQTRVCSKSGGSGQPLLV